MNVRDVQTLLAKAGYYEGAIDGDAGPLTRRAVELVEANGRHDWSGWSQSRRLIAAAQVILGALGYEPGAIDGYWGPNTREALTDFQTELTTGRRPTVERELKRPEPEAAERYPRQRDMPNFYGPAGSAAATAGRCELPFPFVIAWNTAQRVSSVSCHERIAQPFTAIFGEAARHYGEAEYRRLRLDRFGGCYNNRNMRGGSRKSTHAWGAAVDLDPENNQLRWGADRARFAQQEYEPFWRIVEAHGMVSLGRVADRDWMHFQAARL